MDLVVGATGFLGTEICRRLRERGEDVRALVRKTSEALKVERLKTFGCEIVVGDLQDKASLDRACKGIETVISTASTTVSRQKHDSLDKTDLQGQLNLIDAAERNDVKRFVLVSFSGNLEGETKLHNAKRKVEEKLRAELRPGTNLQHRAPPLPPRLPSRHSCSTFSSPRCRRCLQCLRLRRCLRCRLWIFRRSTS